MKLGAGARKLSWRGNERGGKGAIAKAKAAFDEAKDEHEAKARAIEVERAAIEKQAQDEENRWKKQKEQLEAALRMVRE